MTTRVPGASLGVLLLLWSSVAYPVPPEPAEAPNRPIEEETSSPDRLDSLLDAATQAKCGLSKLNQEERNSLSALLKDYSGEIKALNLAAQTRLRDETDARALGWRPARDELETQGYQLMQAAVVSADDKEYLVVKKRFGMTATNDLPFSFPTFRFKDDMYWCEDAPFGGVRSVIVDGRVHSFTFATWKDL